MITGGLLRLDGVDEDGGVGGGTEVAAEAAAVAGGGGVKTGTVRVCKINLD